MTPMAPAWKEAIISEMVIGFHRFSRRGCTNASMPFTAAALSITGLPSASITSPPAFWMKACGSHSLTS